MGINLKDFATNEYVKCADAFYWHMTKERIASETEKNNNKIKKITALAVTSTVITGAAVTFFVTLMTLRKSRNKF